jgi:uncharacterized membrane protein YbaN (DUF454 family)
VAPGAGLVLCRLAVRNQRVYVAGVTQDVDRTVAARKPRSRLLRGIYFILGLICLGFVYLSVLPGIPTFDFVVLAAFFFSMSSDRLHGWLVNHPVFGKMIRGYRSGGLTVRAKWMGTLGIVGSLAFSALVLTQSTVLRIVLAAVGLVGVWFVLSRPTREQTAPGSAAADRL